MGSRRNENQDNHLVSVDPAYLTKSTVRSQTRPSASVKSTTPKSGATNGAPKLAGRESPQIKVIAIADGMGGAVCGGEASRMVIGTIEDLANQQADKFLRCNDKSRFTLLADWVMACDRMISQFVTASPKTKGMGTTLTVAVVVGNRLYGVHVGDTRCFLVRDGEMRQLTEDHTVAALMSRVSYLEPEEAKSLRHILTNVLSGQLKPENIEQFRMCLEPGDRLLLTSDGVHDWVATQSMAEIVVGAIPDQACASLINAAQVNGSSDDLTAIVCQVTS